MFLDRDIIERAGSVTANRLLSHYAELEANTTLDRQFTDKGLEFAWQTPSEYEENCAEESDEDGFGLDEVVKEVDEELDAIREYLAWDDAAPTAPAPTAHYSEHGAYLRAMMEREARARNAWESLAMPYRRRGEVVYCMLLGEPLSPEHFARSIHVDDFIVQVGLRIASDTVTIKTLSRRLDTWRTAAVLAFVALVPVIGWVFGLV